MHSFFARHMHRQSGEAAATDTKGLVMDQGWRYDVSVGFMNMFMFRGAMRGFRQQTISFARLKPGEAVLDVGCGTGTLAISVRTRIGHSGMVAGIDPGPQQIARARAKAERRHLPINFQLGVIEQIAFPDQTFDVVFSTLMMHHLPVPLKRQGLAEIARMLKPGGRVVIADFIRKQERQGQAARFHAGGSSIPDLVHLVEEAGFSQVATEEMHPQRFSAFPGAIFVRAFTSAVAG